jgi:cyclic pyranopterin phosphate synthase
MPEAGVPLRDKKHFMTSEEIIEIAKTFVKLGVKKIRITGGEPLIKKDIENILTQLSELPVELTITTNAILVDKYIDLFKRIGIKSINVSLDSLKADKFNEMSRRNYFERIKQNIDLLIAQDFIVKVNAVVIKNDNDNEIVDFIKWTLTHPVHIRFIEFMQFDVNNWNWDKKLSFK